jgi:hypothetical protein
LLFKKKLTEARNVLNIIVDYFDHGHLDAASLAELARIQPFPSDISASNMNAPMSI